MKTFKQVVEANADKLHPDALHVKPVKVDGKTKYRVHAVGKNFADGIKKGEHLTDTELDDATEIGAKIKHIKEEGSWLSTKKKKTASEPITSTEHAALQSRGEQSKKGVGMEESVDYRARFVSLLNQHGYGQKLIEWVDVLREGEQKSAIASIASNIANRKVSTDKDTDIIRDYDEDDIRKQEIIKRNKHHHATVKAFRAYKEDLDEAISSRQALSKAADFEFKAANTDDPYLEKTMKGKAKALRRAARLAQEVAGTVDVSISTPKS